MHGVMCGPQRTRPAHLPLLLSDILHEYEPHSPGWLGHSLRRAFREDRTLVAATGFIAGALGQRFVEGVPLNLEQAWAESKPRTPLICLLSPGEAAGQPPHLPGGTLLQKPRSCRVPLA